MRTDRGSGAVVAAVIGAVITGIATVVAAVIAVHPGGSGGSTGAGPSTGETAIFLSKESAPGGAEVKVSGRGFAPGETVTLRVQVDQVGTTTADGSGRFDNVTITVPAELSVFAPRQFPVSAVGESSVRSAQAPLTVSG